MPNDNGYSSIGLRKRKKIMTIVHSNERSLGFELLRNIFLSQTNRTRKKSDRVLYIVEFDSILIYHDETQEGRIELNE